VPPGNSQALAEAVSGLLNNPDLARRMGDAGRAQAVRLYDQRFVRGRFVRTIESALAQNRPAMVAAKRA
jgi:glycosyltransferase involved in cell wall biosynthesis